MAASCSRAMEHDLLTCFGSTSMRHLSSVHAPHKTFLCMAWCSRLFVSGKGEGGAKHKNWLPVAHDHSATIRPRIVKIPLTDLTHIGFFSLSDKWHLGWGTLRPAASLGKTAPCSWLAQLQSTLPCRPSLSKWLYLSALGCVSPALTPRNSSPSAKAFSVRLPPNLCPGALGSAVAKQQLCLWCLRAVSCTAECLSRYL